MMNSERITKNKKNENASSDEISGKSKILLNSLICYYRNNPQILNCIITHKNTLSLRVLDWLVTNYAKKNNIVYKLNKEVNNSNVIINFNIYLDYKNQLKAYSKKLFDPFCRRERIKLNVKTLDWEYYDSSIKDEKEIDKSSYMITTVGQLNFFKWFIENEVLNYSIENIEKIDKDMMETLNINKSNHKRKELSHSASKTLCKHEFDTLIKFN